MKDSINDLYEKLITVDREIIDALLLFFLSSVVFLFVKNRVVKLFTFVNKKRENSTEKIILKEIKSFPNLIIVFVSLYISYSSLRYRITNQTVTQIIDVVFYAILGFYVIRLLAKIIRRISDKLLENTKDSTTRNVYQYITNISQFLLWFVAAIFIFSNLGYDVSALLAGIGISGLAIAIGMRKIIFDVLSSIVIILDRPFKIGDYIQVKDAQQGVVTKIGLRSVRLQKHDKSEVVVSNGEMISKPIVNYKNLKRSEFSFDVEITNDSIKDINASKLIRKEFSTQAEEVIYDRFIYVLKQTEEFTTIRIEIVAKVNNKLADETIDLMQNLIVESLKKYELNYKTISTNYEKIT